MLGGASEPTHTRHVAGCGAALAPQPGTAPVLDTAPSPPLVDPSRQRGQPEAPREELVGGPVALGELASAAQSGTRDNEKQPLLSQTAQLESWVERAQEELRARQESLRDRLARQR